MKKSSKVLAVLGVGAAVSCMTVSIASYASSITPDEIPEEAKYNDTIISGELKEDNPEIDLFAYADTVKANLGKEYNATDYYGVNQDGSTYGSMAWAAGPDDRPDLILTEADNGKLGYVYAVDLDGEKPSSPEEAAIWKETHTGYTINVYESDGKTIIGTFAIE